MCERSSGDLGWGDIVGLVAVGGERAGGLLLTEGVGARDGDDDADEWVRGASNGGAWVWLAIRSSREKPPVEVPAERFGDVWRLGVDRGGGLPHGIGSWAIRGPSSFVHVTL